MAPEEAPGWVEETAAGWVAVVARQAAAGRVAAAEAVRVEAVADLAPAWVAGRVARVARWASEDLEVGS